MQFGIINTPQQLELSQPPVQAQSQLKPMGSHSELGRSVDVKPQPASLIPHASKLSPRLPNKQSNRAHYTTTYNASYQKP